MTRKGGEWTTKIANPGAGSVALRTTAKAKSGASVTETVLDAYLIR